MLWAKFERTVGRERFARGRGGVLIRPAAENGTGRWDVGGKDNMQDIEEIGRRLMVALDRIGNGIAALPVGGGTIASAPAGDDDTAALREALDEERTANAQLQERVRAIKDKQEQVVAALERSVERLTEQLETQSRELQRQRELNAELTETNRALSTAAASGVSQPDLINQALKSELEALRAQRAADLAEMEEIMNELKPLIGEVA